MIAPLTLVAVVFDLDNNIIWMTQYINCGSTPAALASPSTLSTLQGQCTTQRALNDASSSSGGTAAGTGADGTGTSLTTSGVPAASNSSPRSSTMATARVVMSALLAALVACTLSGSVLLL